MASIPDAAFVPTLTVIGTVFTSIVTAWVTLKLGKKKEKVEVQSTINAGFQSLITELQEERKDLMVTVRERGPGCLLGGAGNPN